MGAHGFHLGIQIIEVVDLYIDGMRRGDAGPLKDAFHNDARMFGSLAGTRYDVPISAQTGEGLGELFRVVVRAEQAYDAVLPTAELNRVLQAAVEAQAPPSVRGRPVRLFYATQTGRRPPQVTVFASAPQDVSTSYARYLTGRLAQAFRLVGVPLRLVFRARPRRDATRPRRDRVRSRRSKPVRGRGAPRRR